MIFATFVVIMMVFPLSAIAQSGGVTWLFGNERVVDGSPSKLVFDVLLAATDNDTKAGDLLVYINYDAGVFGNAAYGAGGVTVTPATLIDNASLYRVQINDNASSRVAMTVEYLRPDSPSLASELPTSPTVVFSVEMDMLVDGALADLSFESDLMDAEQFQSDPTERFDVVVASDEVIATPAFGTPNWEVDGAEFDDEMSITASLTLDGEDSGSDYDMVAAFVSGEVRGVTTPIFVDGDYLFFLTVFASLESETVTFRAYDATNDAIVAISESITFNEGTTVGSIPTPLELTGLQAIQDVSLVEGWNLLALNVQLANVAPLAVFASLGDDLEYVTGFNGESIYYDPDGLPFLNTLTSLEIARGYWVKTQSGASFTLSGAPSPADISLDLSEGWNLMGYWPQIGQTPETAFAELIDDDRLSFVSGFGDGAQFFDPELAPELNTLSTLQPGQGYWIKVDRSIDDFVLADPAPSKTSDVVQERKGWTIRHTNEYSFLGGSLFEGELPVAQGKRIEIRNALRRIVGENWMEADGVLSATAVYGDDPTTLEIDGARPGDSLYVVVDGLTLETGVQFSADRVFHRIDLKWIDDESQLPVTVFLDQNYPNPFKDFTTIRYGLPESSDVEITIFDLLGRRVETILNSFVEAGTHQFELRKPGLASGLYIYTLDVNGHRETRTMLRVR